MNKRGVILLVVRRAELVFANEMKCGRKRGEAKTIEASGGTGEN